ncbi:hypothetical protein KI387_041853, partial [Taxus chinensis]
ISENFEARSAKKVEPGALKRFSTVFSGWRVNIRCFQLWRTSINTSIELSTLDFDVVLKETQRSPVSDFLVE